MALADIKAFSCSYSQITAASDWPRLFLHHRCFCLACNIIADVIDPLMKYYVKEKFLTSEEKAHIVTHIAVAEKLKLLLLKISSSLKSGDTRSFHMMLTIMKEHGGKGTQTLADHIMNRLNISTDQLSHVYTVDTTVQYNGPKGLSVVNYRSILVIR